MAGNTALLKIKEFLLHIMTFRVACEKCIIPFIPVVSTAFFWTVFLELHLFHISYINTHRTTSYYSPYWLWVFLDLRP